MNDSILKIKMSYKYIKDGFHTWKTYVYKCDLDEQMCCDGYLCGCQGLTFREIYTKDK